MKAGPRLGVTCSNGFPDGFLHRLRVGSFGPPATEVGEIEIARLDRSQSESQSLTHMNDVLLARENCGNMSGPNEDSIVEIDPCPILESKPDESALPAGQ